jgi:orotidine-5'-phosphate decarboxylase
MKDWDDNHNCALVIGSPYPKELANVRKLLGDEVNILIPGAGTQGGSVKDTVIAGVNSEGNGVMINSSREVLYASNEDDFATAARQKAIMLKEEINKYR